MNALTQKLMQLERALSNERGGFTLFALLLRADTEGVSDLVVSAPWLKHGSRADLEFVVSKVRQTLTDDEMLQLSAVVILEPTNPVVRAINSMVSAEHVDMMFQNNQINDMFIPGGLVITSKRRGVSE